jgi:hypothetical protein
MTDRPNLLEAIREADGALSSVRLGPHASHRIRTAIREHATGQGRAWRAWFVPAALGAAALVLALAMGAGRAFQSKSAGPGECITSSSADTIALKGPCKLSLGAMDIETSGATTLSEMPDGAHLRSGMAIFRVRPVPAGHGPVRIRVGGGVIEVIGTTFVLEQHRGGGSLELLEGTIRFVSSSLQSTILQAGERLSWVDDAPTPSSAISSVAPSFPGTPSRTGSEPADNGREPPEDLDADDRPRLEAALRRFKQLRREARYTEQERLRGELEPASFELGNALESAHAERSRVCAHWRWHLGRFSAGIYNGAIEKKMRNLGCPP